MKNLATNAKKKLETINGKLSGMDVGYALEKATGLQLQESVRAMHSIAKDLSKKYD